MARDSRRRSCGEFRFELEETAEVLSDSDALSALEAGVAEIERGEIVTLSDLRTELAERRPTAS